MHQRTKAHLQIPISILPCEESCGTRVLRCCLISALAIAVLASCGGGGSSTSTENADAHLSAPGSTPEPTVVLRTMAASACNFPGDDVARLPTPPPLASPLAVTRSASTDGLYDGPYGAHELRAIYGLSKAPSNVESLSPQARALLGEGQTIYVVVAYHDPAVFEHLDVYSRNYGLPSCSVVPAEGAAPLRAPAPGAGCTVMAVGADVSGNFSSLPAFGAGWALEEALDVEMAHAAAPLARIVVVAAENDSIPALQGAIRLANRMGNGVVSMSWGSPDNPSLRAADPLFATRGMAYVAAAGNHGYDPAQMWPAAVSTVLAVGGTIASWNGALRTEAAWPGGGGGMSSHRAVPPYQEGYAISSSTGCVQAAGRMIPDVSAHAGGVFVYASGEEGYGYSSLAGTSSATAWWAGLLASANAARALAGKPALASIHDVLYGSIGRDRGRYADVFLDVADGSNGACFTCGSTPGFDLATGLGVPNATSLFSAVAAY